MEEEEEREMEIPRLCPLLQGTNATCGELAPEWSFDKNMVGGDPIGCNNKRGAYY